jgi:hypothetical protein
MKNKPNNKHQEVPKGFVPYLEYMRQVIGVDISRGDLMAIKEVMRSKGICVDNMTNKQLINRVLRFYFKEAK